MKKNVIYSEYDISSEHFDHLNNANTIGIDTEALGLNIKRDRLCLIQICDYRDETVYVIHFKNSDYTKSKNLIRLLKNKKIEKIFHFARFDIAIIYFYLKVFCENTFCTKVMSKIARTFTERHGLKELCSKLLGVELNKNSCSSYWGGDLTEDQKKYATNDVLHLLELKKKLEEILVKEKRMDLAILCMENLKMFILCDLENYDPIYIMNHH